MVNAKSSNIDYFNPTADGQDSNDVIGGEDSAANSPNKQRERCVNNPSVHENDGSTTSKRFKFVSEE